MLRCNCSSLSKITGSFTNGNNHCGSVHFKKHEKVKRRFSEHTQNQQFTIYFVAVAQLKNSTIMPIY